MIPKARFLINRTGDPSLTYVMYVETDEGYYLQEYERYRKVGTFGGTGESVLAHRTILFLGKDGRLFLTETWKPDMGDSIRRNRFMRTVKCTKWDTSGKIARGIDSREITLIVSFDTFDLKDYSRTKSKASKEDKPADHKGVSAQNTW